jgi:putative GTP pyrophosphokinase
MSNAELDRLGERLRGWINVTDLTHLDAYRRGFRPAYNGVVDRLRGELGLEVSGRPAKSTAAIVDKLRRGSMRLAQMQDIAGCRVVVPDITTQSRLVATLEAMFEVTLLDRRAKPSHGYRAVHVVARSEGLPVEIQVRTDLQHVWAELSEKLADTYGMSLKYGEGPKNIRKTLDDYSSLIAEFEQHLDLDGSGDERVTQLKNKIRHAMIDLTSALREQP